MKAFLKMKLPWNTHILLNTYLTFMKIVSPGRCVTEQIFQYLATTQTIIVKPSSWSL